jgi:hypothetical protein
MREASPDEVMGGGSGGPPAELNAGGGSNDKTNSGSGGGDEVMNDGGSGDGSGADDTQKPQHEPALRFDFHDFPRKTDQADDANAEVRASVREVGRTAKVLAKREKAAEKTKASGAAAAAAPKAEAGGKRAARSKARGAAVADAPKSVDEKLSRKTQKKTAQKDPSREAPPPVPEDASDATKKPFGAERDAKTRAKDVFSSLAEAPRLSLGADGASKRGGDLRALAARDAAAAKTADAFKAPAPMNRGGGASLPRMPPSGYRGARGAVSAEQTKPRGEAEKTKPNAVAENPTLARSTHRSIFLAGGAVANVHRIAVDFGHQRSRAGALSGGVNVAYASANGNGVVDQIFESGKHVEVILGARARTAAFGDPLQTDPAQVPRRVPGEVDRALAHPQLVDGGGHAGPARARQVR